ncbi:MAG: metallophosphoesterase family protein, partial [Desulfovibrionales bacterium]
MRVAAIGDLHCTTRSQGMVRELLDGVNQDADVLVMAGDLTNVGLPEEMDVLLEDLTFVSLPIVAVVGNHDHENDHAETLIQMLEHRGICVLSCSVCEINGVGFIGTKGFCGGFDRFRVETFGERALKSFVQTSIDEAARLGKTLSQMENKRKIAILHYAPVKQTLQGESPELYPFLGSSLLADALDRH